jgi:hypothetical protein
LISRYTTRRVFKNDSERYQDMFNVRNVKYINQYSTPEFEYPDVDNYDRIETIEHVWSIGDRFYKLAGEYYGDVNNWWVIAKFNNLPTESHVKLGDVILIPTPLHEILNIMKG